MGFTRTGRIKLGLFGAGAVAACVVEKALSLSEVDLVGFTARSETRASQFAARFQIARLDPGRMIETCDVIIEAAHPAALQCFAPLALEQGKILIVMSVNGLIGCPSLVDDASRRGGRLILVSGALAGLDAIAAARISGIDRVRLKSSKPPHAFRGHFQDGGPREPVRIFAGTAREAAARFPRNTNVAASLALAAFDVETGPDRVLVEIWADPTLSANIHEIEVLSGAGTIHASVLNQALPDNAATSQLAANSAVAALQKLIAPCIFA